VRDLLRSSALEQTTYPNCLDFLVIEANKFAYGQRSNFGDPAFTPNVTTLERLYLTEPVVEAARAKINDTATFGTSFYTPSGYVPGPEAGTSHLAVVDGDGMAVSLTT
jgi:gamma-glutamyltranspeptidase/glutathione hydrolase